MTPTKKDSTALQELIDRIELARQNSHKKYHPSFDYWIIEAKSLLPKEREVIEDAYNQGDADRDNQQDGNGRDFKNCIDYFTQTFKQ